MWKCPNFLQNWSKSLSNSKLKACLVLGIKLRPLLTKRIWGSPPDKLITNYLVYVVLLVIVQVVATSSNIKLYNEFINIVKVSLSTFSCCFIFQFEWSPGIVFLMSFPLDDGPFFGSLHFWCLGRKVKMLQRANDDDDEVALHEIEDKY